MRKLTPRQTAVLAAVERLGRPTMLDLSREFGFAPSEIARVLEVLEERGLIARAGDPALIYTGGVRFWASGASTQGRGDRLESLVRSFVEGNDADIRAWVEADQDAVVIALPLEAVARDLSGRGDSIYETVQTLVSAGWTDGSVGAIEVAPELTNVQGAPAIAVKVRPAQ